LSVLDVLGGETLDVVREAETEAAHVDGLGEGDLELPAALVEHVGWGRARPANVEVAMVLNTHIIVYIKNGIYLKCELVYVYATMLPIACA